MKTTVKSVIVEVMDGGKLKRHIYPIVTSDGELMTHRLERLLKGKLGHGRVATYGEPRDIHYVGMVWYAPYMLLEELVQDRLKLQQKLQESGDESPVANLPITEVPDGESCHRVTELMLRELRYRRQIKARINYLGQQKPKRVSIRGSETEQLPMESLGWVQP